MPSCVVTCTGGTITTNGAPLPVGACRGLAAPFTISGDGEFYLSVNPDPPVEIPGPENIEFVPATPVSVTLIDGRGLIAAVQENTRYPEEGSFPINSPVTVE